MEEDSLPILLSVVDFVAAAFFLPVLHCRFFFLPCFAAGCFAPVDCCLALGCCFALDREDVVDISVHDASSVLIVLLLLVRHFFLAGFDFIGGYDASAAVGGVV